MQYDKFEILQLIAFYSKRYNSAKCNYEIYDKELMAIVCAFEYLRPEFEVSTHPIKVVTNYKNHEYLMTTKELSKHKTRWSEF